MSGFWQPLQDEIRRWRDAGLTPNLWLRDDDAIEPTPRLDRLIALTQDFGIPVALAIIPARTGPALAERLAAAPHIHPVIHGWSHANHAPPSEKKQELGPHRPRSAILDELARGLDVLSRLYGEHLVPMLVPPWNRIDATLLDDLPKHGISALSAFGRKLTSRPGLTIVNTHIDIIDSRASNACRNPAWLAATLTQELADARAVGGRPLGILSHHLVSNDAAFHFLQDLFTTAPPGMANWRTPRELLQD